MDSKHFPKFKFNLSDVEYFLLNKRNYKDLAAHMKRTDNHRLLVMSTDDESGWNEDYLPGMDSFDFLEELSIHWTKVDDITEAHKCKNVKTLLLDNGDKTKLDYSVFTKLENFVSWDRKGIENIWDVSGLKTLTVAGLKRNHFKIGKAMETINKLRIITTPVDNIDFLGNCRQLTFLELKGMSKLEKMDILGTLTDLIHLRIEANKVRDFSFIAKLINLQKCYLSSKSAEMKYEDFINFKDIKKLVVDGNNKALEVDRLLQKFYGNG